MQEESQKARHMKRVAEQEVHDLQEQLQDAKVSLFALIVFFMYMHRSFRLLACTSLLLDLCLDSMQCLN